ncbi:MAG TPA: DUF1549 domain-containing protein, partial [Lacipirellula sp.]
MRFRLLLPLITLAAFGAGAHAAEQSAAEKPIRFSRDIRPILSQNCLLCHGQDETRQGGGVRLDERPLALAEADSGLLPIVPGKPDESELIARISAEDEMRMPPPDSHKTLTREQIELLTRWVAEGAEYEPHWSFIPLERPEVPAIGDVADAGGTRSVHPIDAFIRERLKREGMQPAEAADRRTLIRRLTLDLTGLPPTSAEIQAFLSDDKPGAYERVVDRLLASPHFGERMALDWMDAARYADTQGYHIDSHRDMWAWRDWVIKAFNENLPFDKFTVWQLAGDMLPDATREQRVASGFNRNHPINFEGGAIPEEYHVEYVVDRVSTTGSVWLGLTLGCARCHDHKYDPISQKEFFELFAFFNNVDEEGLDGRRGNARPILELPSDEQTRTSARLSREIKQLEEKLAELDSKRSETQHHWEQHAAELAKSADVTLSDWLQWGPIAVDTPEIGLAESFGVASPVDRKVTHKDANGEHGWLPAPQHIDGKLMNLGRGGDASVAYLARTMETDEPRIVRAHVGTNDAMQMWLNGKLVFERGTQQVFSPRQHAVELPLVA